MLWILVLLLLLFAVVGGIAVSKFIFLLLIVALVLAALGAFNRSTHDRRPEAPFGMPRSVVDPKAGRGPPAGRRCPPTRQPGAWSEATRPQLPFLRRASLDGIVGMPVLAEAAAGGNRRDVVVNDSLTTVLGVDLTTAGDHGRTKDALPAVVSARAGAAPCAPQQRGAAAEQRDRPDPGAWPTPSDRPVRRGGVVTPLGDIRLR